MKERTVSFGKEGKKKQADTVENKGEKKTDRYGNERKNRQIWKRKKDKKLADTEIKERKKNRRIEKRMKEMTGSYGKKRKKMEIGKRKEG